VNDERDIERERWSASHGEADPADGSGPPGDRSDKIGVGAGDENVAKIQLAARWAEAYAPDGGGSLDDALRRFKRAYQYLDSVTKLVEPDES
jgi:hypothetical protein